MGSLKWVLPLLVGCFFLSSAGAANKVGPAALAKTDRHLWQEPIDTPAGFDAASRAALLIYTLALEDMQQLSDPAMLAAFKIKSINRASVEKWLKKEQQLSLRNYQDAAQGCAASDWACVGSITTVEALQQAATKATLNLPPKLLAWRDSLNNFAHDYVAEQLRLAALFPKISSEIDLFNSNEWNGDALADRQFFLTFDDGPTDASGTTDQTLAMLDKEKKSGVFFILGKHLQSRLSKTTPTALAALYNKQCVGLHGWEHQSHAKWEQWQDSITRTQALLHTTLGAGQTVPLFRPPYGQRKEDSGAFFQAQALQVALWNLDSQDWNHSVDVDDIVNRMTALMLIKRHGVLLFHDIHPKAQAALPILFQELGKAVVWGDCHSLASH
jgi:peptidoglycan/xylan/chitin deacetylase (PgdA/CDA1 family)